MTQNRVRTVWVAVLVTFWWVADVCRASPVLLAGTGDERVRITDVVIVYTQDRTHLAFMPDYTGPKQDFAIIFAVPSGVEREDVYAPSSALVQRLVKLGAPRFAEFWEKHPCEPGPAQPPWPEPVEVAGAKPPAIPALPESRRRARPHDWEYSRPFVGSESELLTWLKQARLRPAEGTREALGEYSRQQRRFMAFKVEVDKVRFFDKESARLSPVGFSAKGKLARVFARLGLPSLGEAHDLYVHALHAERLRALNYATRFASTNLTVDLFVRTRLAEFYNGLFDEFQERHPETFLQEYAWPALECAPPCPAEPLTVNELVDLGATMSEDYVLSRLHYRYSKRELSLDPEVGPGAPMTGGAALPVGPEARADGKLRATEANAFVTRFTHAHRFRRPASCNSPERFRWGAPPIKPPGAPEVFIAENMSRKRRDQFGLDTAIPNEKVEFFAAQGEAMSPSAGQGWLPPISCSCRAPASRSAAWLGLAVLLGLMSILRRAGRAQG